MFDCVSFLKEYKIPYTEKGKNVGREWIGMKCPFHDDVSNHLGFNLIKGYFFCWVCGHVSIVNSIMGLLSVTKEEAYRIYKLFSDSVEYGETTEEIKRNINIPDLPLNENEKKYLSNRGFDWKELVEEFDLRSGGYTGIYKYRIIIPFYYGGRIVTFQGRAIYKQQEPKYLSARSEDSLVDIKDFLFNIDKEDGYKVILVEGVFDVFKLGNNCVASCGMYMTKKQLCLLAQFDSVFILFDNEEEAQKRANRYGEELSLVGVKEVEIIRLNEYKDVADMSNIEARLLKRKLL